MLLTNQERRFKKALERRADWLEKKTARLREEGMTTGSILYMDEELAAIRWVFRMIEEIEEVPGEQRAAPQ
jgi:hypothetical protein